MSETFDQIVAGLDIADEIPTCVGCHEQANLRVKHACTKDDEIDLMCEECFNAYCAYMLAGQVRAMFTGETMVHNCGTPIETPMDIVTHVLPENMDGSPYTGEPR